jgi:hypothetical protein
MTESRRAAIAAFTVFAPGLVLPTAALAQSEPKSIAEVKARFPVLARSEGVWAGTFRRLDAEGRIVAEFKSRVTKRYLVDAPWPRIYHQTNHYEFPDGTSQHLETYGEFRDGRIHFESERVKGWQLDDPADPYKRTVLLHMVYKDRPEEYVYELINVSDDGRYRTRMTQFLKDGRTVQRTLIDEEKLAAG